MKGIGQITLWTTQTWQMFPSLRLPHMAVPVGQIAGDSWIMQKKVMKKIVILGISTMMGMILAQSEEYEVKEVDAEYVAETAPPAESQGAGEEE